MVVFITYKLRAVWYCHVLSTALARAFPSAWVYPRFRTLGISVRRMRLLVCRGLPIRAVWHMHCPAFRLTARQCT